MDIVIIGLCAALASLLTFFSGFGLGTLLTPVFMIFFPIEIAIALTGIVHLLNNLFKAILIGKHANWNILLRFGIPAILGAFAGAYLLTHFNTETCLAQYTLGGRTFCITALKLLIAALMIFFALFEMLPSLKKLEFGKDKLAFGGLISGFFGGLSGHQGALRSAFLIRFRLSKEAFIATGIFIACFIDITRLTVYYRNIENINLQENYKVLLVAVLCAFAGAFLGSKLLKKVTLAAVQNIVAVCIILLALALGLGII
jgi:uncharacterized protein